MQVPSVSAVHSRGHLHAVGTAQHRRQKIEQGRLHLVVDPGGPALAGYQTRLPQHLEVVRDRRPRQIESAREIADARLPTLVRRDQGEQAKSNRITHRLEDPGKLLSFLRRDGLAGLGEQQSVRGR